MNNFSYANKDRDFRRLPEWLQKKWTHSENVLKMERLLRNRHLFTVCQSASCPNLSQCFQKSTVTFMILGNVCTRHCRFCGVKQGNPLPVDSREPEHIAEAVYELGLNHVIITSVTRDDLADGGASQFVSAAAAIKKRLSATTVEILIPDFKGDIYALKQVVNADIHVLTHNIETVPRLYPEIRPEADFQRSIDILANAKQMRPELKIKSGLMLGLGESEEEVIEVFKMLHEASCELLTIGQYLAPRLDKAPVREYLHPTYFNHYAKIAEETGIRYVKAGPYVRSSFEAEAMMKMIRGA